MRRVYTDKVKRGLAAIEGEMGGVASDMAEEGREEAAGEVFAALEWIEAQRRRAERRRMK